MKKIFVLFAVFCIAMAIGSPAMAIDNENSPGSTITVDDGAATPNELTFSFSPSVVGQYLADASGTVNNQQWFALATYHGGGTSFYGTTSSQTVIWKKDRTTDETLADAAIPTASDATEGEECTEDDPPVCTPIGWSDGWSK